MFLNRSSYVWYQTIIVGNCPDFRAPPLFCGTGKRNVEGTVNLGYNEVANHRNPSLHTEFAITIEVVG